VGEEGARDTGRIDELNQMMLAIGYAGHQGLIKEGRVIVKRIMGCASGSFVLRTLVSCTLLHNK
jgi:hypothetical protein